MARYLLIILLFFFSVSYGQDYPSANYARWEYGSSGYSLKSFRIDLQNNSPYVIKEIKMRVWVYDDVGGFYEHNKTQTFKVNIQGYELGKTPTIALSNRRILRYYRSFEGMSWGSEILDVKFYKTPQQIAEEREEQERMRLEALRIEQEEIEQERIRQAQIELARKIELTHSKALEFYKSNKLYEAQNYFKEVLKLDPNHVDANQKSNEITIFFSIRSGAGFVYREDNSNSFNNLKREITNLLNNEINDTPEGSYQFKVSIQFDTNGVNNSRIEGVSNEVVLKKISNILTSNTLSPSKKFSYYVNSHDSFTIDANWNSSDEYVVSDGKGINGVDKYFKINPSDFKDYINAQSYKYGNFTFDVKSKLIKIDGNQQADKDIRLIDYKLNAGPQYAFCSLVLPGWGASKVSSGQNGYLTGSAYLLSLSMAGVTKVLENLDYKAYQEAQNQNAASEAYDAVNADRKLFMVCIGAVGLAYVYDFSWSLVKGFGNIKKSAYYRKKLKESPIDVKLSKF